MLAFKATGMAKSKKPGLSPMLLDSLAGANELNTNTGQFLHLIIGSLEESTSFYHCILQSFSIVDMVHQHLKWQAGHNNVLCLINFSISGYCLFPFQARLNNFMFTGYKIFQ